MSGAWQVIPLGDVIELKRGYDLPTSERIAGNFPIISSSGPSGWHNECKAKGPGVVTGRYGTIGEVFFIEGDYWPLNTTLYVRDFKGNDPRFISYFLRSLDFQSFNDKSSVPGLNRNDLHRLEVSVPSPAEQRAIAAVLGSLDDKIEHNRRTSRALEGLARAMFKAWFVDFEPVHAKAAGATSFPGISPDAFAVFPTCLINSQLGLVPEGWGAPIPVAELERMKWLLIGDGYRAKRSELADVGVPFIRAGNVNGTIQTEGAELLGLSAVAKAGVKRSQAWDTVFTSKGTVGRIGLVTPATGEVVYAPQVCFWRSTDTDSLSPFWLHMWMKSDRFTNQWMSVKGQTDMADFVSLSDQRMMTILVPPSLVQQAFDRVVRPLIELQATLEAESRKLAELRDYLLPKLLSGEVRVGQGQQETAACLQ